MRLTFNTQTVHTKGECKGWEALEVSTGEGEHIDLLSAGGKWHSMNIWKGGVRKKENLVAKTGIMLDFDDGTTRRELTDKLNMLGCSYILVPSKSHMVAKGEKPACERWHLYLPFDRLSSCTAGSTTDLAIANFMAYHFGPLGLDPIFDGARFFYPGGAADLVLTCDATPLTTEDIRNGFGGGTQAAEYAHGRVRETKTERIIAPSVLKAGRGGEYWRKNQDIDLGNGQIVKASEVETKTACRCINPDHADTNPSAFVAFNSDGQQFVHCSSCKLTWWEKDWMKPYLETWFAIDDVLHKFHGAEAVTWDYHKASPDAIIAPTPESKRGLIALLKRDPLCSAKMKVIREKSGNRPCSPSKNPIKSTLRCPTPLQPASDQILPDKGNPMVETWLHEMFGEYDEFIKNWIAVYAHTNFRRLPILVLNGDRGVGKSGFADLIKDLYPDMSRSWDGDGGGFNDELDSVFVHIDELPAAEHSHKESKKFYRLTKSTTGGKDIAINRKYGKKYEVPNNVSIVVTTNDMDPIHLDPFEKPTSETNNQFFVLRITRKVNVDYDVWDAVKDAFPGWVRTEGHRRYLDWWNSDTRKRTRYSIPCPITPDEVSAYEESKTGIEHLAPGLWAALDTGHYGRIPVGVDRTKGFFTMEDMRALIGAAGLTQSPEHLTDIFRKFKWIEQNSVNKWHNGRQQRGRAPTEAGKALWKSTDPNT